MPNHVKNKFEFYGDQKEIDELLLYIKTNDATYISFDNIIPIPNNIYQGDFGEKERKMFGKNNWYDWCRENWGTKWNAYNQKSGENCIMFDTAWSAPHPIALALSNKFRGIKIIHTWADEDCGCNAGKSNYKNGFCSGGYFENNSNDAYETYIALHGKNHCLYKDDCNNWKKYSCDVCPHKC